MLGHGGVAPVPGTAHVGGDALTLMEGAYKKRLTLAVSGVNIVCIDSL